MDINNAEILSLPLRSIFEPQPDSRIDSIVKSAKFERVHCKAFADAEILLDSYPGEPGASCCFIRIPEGSYTSVRIIIEGVYSITSCNAGGWILEPTDNSDPSYWIPQPAIARKLDTNHRILSENAALISNFSLSDDILSLVLAAPGNFSLDLVVWRFASGPSDIPAELGKLLALETQPYYLWTSQTEYTTPADFYRYMVHGHVYVDRFIWPRKWKIPSELDAYGLYMIMTGMKLATEKRIYELLRRQLLFSVITRQSADGGWYHGEWTDQMESHYRFHNGAMLLLESSLQEETDAVVSNALEKAAEFISRYSDKTDIGQWFLHDSLEENPELMKQLCRQTGSTWIPANTLGKSQTNKLILNTHIDTIVTLERYRAITGDDRYKNQVDSALAAARTILSFKPAELIYRMLYRAVKLTLLPENKARKLPLAVRAFKRLTWMYITPKLLPAVKRRHPRLVMPGGYIERHLGMPHYDINYHAVNVFDLARMWRSFPEEELGGIISEAVEVVSSSSIQEYWAEARQRHFALVVWVDALYQLCTLMNHASYRQLLAEGIIMLHDTGVGLPPSILGSDAEAVDIPYRASSPSPTDENLRVVNLCRKGHKEMLVINSTDTDRALSWETNTAPSLTWVTHSGQPLASNDSPPIVSSRSWIWGRVP